MESIDISLEKVILVLTELQQYEITGTIHLDGEDFVLRFNSTNGSDIEETTAKI
jgi:hypothetical protein